MRLCYLLNTHLRGLPPDLNSPADTLWIACREFSRLYAYCALSEFVQDVWLFAANPKIRFHVNVYSIGVSLLQELSCSAAQYESQIASFNCRMDSWINREWRGPRGRRSLGYSRGTLLHGEHSWARGLIVVSEQQRRRQYIWYSLYCRDLLRKSTATVRYGTPL